MDNEVSIEDFLKGISSPEDKSGEEQNGSSKEGLSPAKSDGDNTERDYTPDETEFAVFCIEALAEYLHMDAGKIYDVLTKDTDLLDGYIMITASKA